MDFDKPKVYGDTFISDGLVYIQIQPQVRSLKKVHIDNLFYNLSEVEFVSAVSAGGSVKFLPAV